MSKEDRQAEFDRLFAALPGRNIDRLRKVAGILCCEVNTIRVYRLKTDNVKVIPEAKLKILRRELEREGLVQAETEKAEAATS